MDDDDGAVSAAIEDDVRDAGDGDEGASDGDGDAESDGDAHGDGPGAGSGADRGDAGRRCRGGRGRGNEGRWQKPTSTAGNPLTLHKYLKCVLLQKPRLFALPRLACEWLLDGYSRAVNLQMTYMRRAALMRFKGRTQMVAPRRDAQVVVEPAAGGAAVGRALPKMLPGSVLGSNAHQSRLIQDGMAVINTLGTPTLFITMTCNPAWPDIQDKLLQEQTAAERPDVVVSPRPRDRFVVFVSVSSATVMFGGGVGCIVCSSGTCIQGACDGLAAESAGGHVLWAAVTVHSVGD